MNEHQVTSKRTTKMGAKENLLKKNEEKKSVKICLHLEKETNSLVKQ
jgi:hypothetical protein